MNIFVIGTGNVAYSLIPALQKANHTITGIYGRTAKHTEEISKLYDIKSFANFNQIPQNTEVIIICTADKGIATTAEALKTDKIVLHTSGSTDIDVLKNYFSNCGVMYPTQTFTKGRLVDFLEIPLLVEASNEATVLTVKKLATSISKDVREMTSQQRRILHLSAVFACNFTNHLIAISQVLMKENDVDFCLLKPLVEETMKKAMNSDPILGQSGPAKRNDTETLNMHLEMLNHNPTLKNIYNNISNSIIEYKEKYKNGLPK